MEANLLWVGCGVVMAHIHTGPGQHDLTVSAFIVREAAEGWRLLLHRHKTLGIPLQPGGHVELDENPWAAILREIAEETGYAPEQLMVLQPPVRVPETVDGTAIHHPQPVSVRTHDFDADGQHRHIDLGFAFLVGSEPTGDRSAGESAELMWVGTEELAALPDIPENVRTIAMFVLEQARSAWEPVPLSRF